MILHLGEYVVRSLVRGDAVSLARHANNPLVARSLRDRFPSPYSLEDAKAFIRGIAASHPHLAYAVANEKGAFGVIGFIPGQDVYHRSAEVGFWIGEDFWNQGIMSAAVDAFAEFLFENFDFNRLYSGIFSSNPASARVLEKAGFRREGTLRAHIYKNGEVLDEWLYARTRPGL